MDTKAVSSEFFNVLAACHWPGNVRELINVLEYALVNAEQDPTLFPKHLPPEYRVAELDFDPMPTASPSRETGQTMDETNDLPCLREYRTRMEKKYLKMLLNKTRGDRDQAILISGISQSRLYGLLKKHNLSGFGSPS